MLKSSVPRKAKISSEEGVLNAAPAKPVVFGFDSKSTSVQSSIVERIESWGTVVENAGVPDAL